MNVESFTRFIGFVLLAVLVISPAIALDSKEVTNALSITQYSPYCDNCIFCYVTNDTLLKTEITVSDISETAINFETKMPYLTSINEKVNPTDLELERSVHKRDEGLEICYQWQRDRNDIVDIIPIVLGFDQTQWATWSPTAITWTNPTDGDDIDTDIVNNIDTHHTVQSSDVCNSSWRWELPSGPTYGTWSLSLGNLSYEETNTTTCSGGQCECVPYTADWSGGIRDGGYVTNIWCNGGWEVASETTNDKAIGCGGVCPQEMLRYENKFPYDNGTVCDVYLYHGGYNCVGIDHFEDVNFSFNNLTWFNFTASGNLACGESVYTGQTIPFNKTWDLHFKEIDSPSTSYAVFDSFILDCGVGGYNFTDSWDITAQADGDYGLRIWTFNNTGHDNSTTYINITLGVVTSTTNITVTVQINTDDLNNAHCSDSDTLLKFTNINVEGVTTFVSDLIECENGCVNSSGINGAVVGYCDPSGEISLQNPFIILLLLVMFVVVIIFATRR